MEPDRYHHPVEEAHVDHRPAMSHPAHHTDDVELTWEASEYIQHHKSMSWFIGFVGIIALLCVVLYLALKDVLAVILMIVMGVAVYVYAVRRPHTLQYSISNEGLIVGHREYSWDDFQSFSILQDGGLPSLLLMPTKRFAPPLTIYFDQRDGDQIIEILSRHLPHEERELDMIDQLARRLRF